MNIVPTNMTIADYCHAMERGEITVNKDYQRSDEVWPPIARSYLIETMVLGLPVPKLSLSQKTDVRTKRTVKEIVDGQQRSRAIQDFYNGQLRLSPSLETETIAGRTYPELEPESQQKFLDFSLSLDLFVSASPEEVVDIFRRMNSYTIPLNPEEQRHARFQGPFKWFINRVAKRFYKSFVDMGVFSEKALVRMSDTKLLAEICDALLNGIRTTSKAKLDNLYSQRDSKDKFPEEADLDKRITDALDQVREWTDIHHGPLMKHYVVYSLILAVIHTHRPVEVLQRAFPSPKLRKFDHGTVIVNLSALSEALENSERPGRFRAFVAACTDQTNTGKHRTERFQWLCKALAEDSL